VWFYKFSQPSSLFRRPPSRSLSAATNNVSRREVPPVSRPPTANPQVIAEVTRTTFSLGNSGGSISNRVVTQHPKQLVCHTELTASEITIDPGQPWLASHIRGTTRNRT